jgi:beta-glucanase (GH16 family)
MTAQLTFNDEFNSLSLWNGASGTWDTTFWYDDHNKGSTLSGNGEQQMYINANYAPTASVKPWTASNGVLTLHAAPASTAISQALGGYKYTSGQINTYHSFSQEYGYFEMKAQLPAGQGLWPAFWLMPTDGSWPPELDVMEVLGNDPTKLYTTVHTDQTGSHTMSTQGKVVGDMSSGYHTYGVDWEADKITFYFDGKEVYQVATPADMHKPMYMMANLAVGGNWPGDADASTPFPANMNIDYIRAWSSNPYADGGATTSGGGVAGGGTTSGGGGTTSAGGGTTSSGGGTAPGTSPPALDGHVAQGTSNDDVLTGQDGVTNHLYGQLGNDRITGGNAFNDVNGNLGNDTIVGRSAVGDLLMGGQGNDSIDAHQSAGHDTVNGNRGDDIVHGSPGADLLRGGQGQDVVNGGAGDDWIAGDLGTNTLTGGQGADTFHGGGSGAVDYVTDFNGGQGDRIELAPGTAHHLSDQADGLHIIMDSGQGGQMVLQGVHQQGFQSAWIV